MSEGWISLHRKILENPIVCKDSDHFAVWVYLLLNATHSEQKMLFKGEEIILQPGQLITGRKSISDKLKISESKVQRILVLFKSKQQIEQQTTTKNRLITIVNWGLYQDNKKDNSKTEQQDELPVNNKRTTTEQQLNTNNNDNNGFNGFNDNKNPIVAEKPAPSEIEKNFEKIYKVYKENVKNTCSGKSKALTSYSNWLKGKKVNGKIVKLTHDQIVKGFGIYYNQCIEKNTEEQFRKNIDTLMNNIIDYVFDN